MVIQVVSLDFSEYQIRLAKLARLAEILNILYLFCLFTMRLSQASKEFTDPRLRIHIVTVLKSMQLSKKKASSTTNLTPMGNGNEISFLTESNSMIPVELFGLLAECEKEKNPGGALLVRAKDLRWSLLAVVASCFPDVSPLSCLTVWLEITAARLIYLFRSLSCFLCCSISVLTCGVALRFLYVKLSCSSFFSVIIAVMLHFNIVAFHSYL